MGEGAGGCRVLRRAALADDELIQRGELPAVRIGERSIRVNYREVEKFLRENCSLGPQ
jgi:hypothetical protein